MVIGNFGRRFQGKTTLAVTTLDVVARRAFLDPRQLIRRAGAVVVRRSSKLRLAFDALAAGDVVELVYSPLENHVEAFEAFARELRRWVIENPDLELGVLIDEATFYVGRGSQLDDVDDFCFVLKSCDLETFHIVLTCHRPTDLSPTIRALMNRWCIFRTTQEHDLDAIRKRCKADVADLVEQLDDKHFVEWNDDDGSFEAHHFPFIWHTELAPRGDLDRILVLQ